MTPSPSVERLQLLHLRLALRQHQLLLQPQGLAPLTAHLARQLQRLHQRPRLTMCLQPLSVVLAMRSASALLHQQQHQQQQCR